MHPSSMPPKSSDPLVPDDVARAVVELASDAVYLFDEQGHLVDVNPSGCELLGYAREDLLRRSVVEVMPDKETAHDSFRLDAQRRHLRHKDGWMVPVDIRTRKLASGHLLTVAHHVTDRQHLAEREAARLGQLKQLFELSVMWSGEPGAIFEQVVRAIGELFKVRVVCLSEIVGSNLSFKAVYVNGQVFRDAGGCPVAITPCATVETTKDVCLFDRVMERFPQAWFLKDHNAFAYCGFPVLDTDGRVVAVTCLLDDKPREFTEEEQALLRLFGQRIAVELERHHHLAVRRQAEEEIQESWARLQAILDYSPTIMFLKDTQGRYLLTNRQFERCFGLSREEIIGKTDAELFPAEQATAFHANDRQVLDVGQGVDFEEVAYYTDGPHTSLVQKFPLCDANGNVYAVGGTVTDITERKRVELALRESEERFRQVAENIQEVFWMTDSEKHTLFYISPAYEEVWGRTCESLYASPRMWLDAIHPDDRARVLQAALTNQVAGDYDETYRIVRPDGSERWIRDRAFPVKDGTGCAYRIAGIAEDITERKRVEQALTEKTHELSDFIEHATVSMHWVGPDGIILWANQAELNLLGYTCEEYIGHHIAEFHVDEPVIQDILDRLGRIEAVQEYAVRLWSKDGSIKDVLIDSSVLWKDGKFVHTRCFTRDITKRKRAEQALRESEGRLQEAQQLAKLGNWELDLASNRLVWSEEIFRIFELDPSQFGASYEAFLNVVHPGDRQEVNEAYTASVRDRTPYEIEHRLRMADGRIKYVREHGRTDYAGDGRPLRSVGTVQDVTAQKVVEQKLAASLREKETLLREVHHRVKNNLQVISSLLRFQSKKVTDPTALIAFQDGQDRLKSMMLVHEKLYRSEGLACIDFGDYVRALTEGVCQSYKHLRAKVHVVVESEPVTLPVEIALPSGMILTELLTNALKYAFPGEVRGTVRIQVLAGMGRFSLTVEDTGVGLPEGLDIEHPTTFGLQLVKGLAVQLNGALTLRRGRGAAMTVDIPY
jgi:PAS domain S-box-containing protein